MTFDPQKIEESKKALRRELAALPIAEKLRILDELRERHLAIHGEGERFQTNGAASQSLTDEPNSQESK